MPPPHIPRHCQPTGFADAAFRANDFSCRRAQLTPEAHVGRGGPHAGSFSQKHVAGIKSMFEGGPKLSGLGKIKETIDFKPEGSEKVAEAEK